MAKNTTPNEPSNDTVSFRMDAEFHRLLQAAATENRQPKANLYARSLVQRALTGGDLIEQKREIEGLRDDVRKLRQDVATVAFVLLVKVAKEDPAKAEAWVRKNLAP